MPELGFIAVILPAKSGAVRTSENVHPLGTSVNTLYWLSLTLGWGSAQPRYACRTGHALCPSLANTLSTRGPSATRGLTLSSPCGPMSP